MKAVVAHALAKSWNGFLAIDLDALEVERGAALAVLGPNGAGKSTLLRLLGLLATPDRGNIELLGVPVPRRPGLALRRRITYVGQAPYLFRGTVAEEAGRGLGYRGVGRELRARRVATELASAGLSSLAQRDARALSGGEALRLALARALVLEPELLLLDEPTSGLDVEARQALEQALARARERSTVLFATHDPVFAARNASAVLRLDRGRRVVESGPAAGSDGLERHPLAHQ